MSCHTFWRYLEQGQAGVPRSHFPGLAQFRCRVGVAGSAGHLSERAGPLVRGFPGAPFGADERETPPVASRPEAIDGVMGVDDLDLLSTTDPLEIKGCGPENTGCLNAEKPYKRDNGSAGTDTCPLTATLPGCYAGGMAFRREHILAPRPGCGSWTQGNRPPALG